MKLPKLIDFLFGSLPREIGYERNGIFNRYDVYSKKELLNIILIYGNSFDISLYIGIYNFEQDLVAIDKVIFDIDDEDLNRSLETAKLIVSKLNEEEIPHIVVFSGKKGFHIYALFEKYLTTRERAICLLREFYDKVTPKEIRNVDFHLRGNVGGLIRIPFTRNGRMYSNVLPSISLNLSQIFSWCSIYKGDFTMKLLYERRRITEFVSCDERYEERDERPDLNIGSEFYPNIELLHLLVRPCIMREVLKSHPTHFIRLAFVSEMIGLGFSEQQINEVIKHLNWEDYQEETTKGFVSELYRKKYKPMRCKTIRPYVRCENCSSWWK